MRTGTLDPHDLLVLAGTWHLSFWGSSRKCSIMHYLMTAYFNYGRSLLSKDNLCVGQPTESEAPLKGNQDFTVDSVGKK